MKKYCVKILILAAAALLLSSKTTPCMAAQKNEKIDNNSSVGPNSPDGKTEPLRQWRQERQAYFKWLEQNFPERAEKLVRLKETDPNSYKKLVTLGYKRYQWIKEAEKKNPEFAETLKLNRELRQKREDLLAKIKTTTDETKKKALVKELEGVVGQKFDIILQLKQMEYDRLRDELKKMEKEISESEALVQKWKDPKFKKESVKKRVEDMLSGKQKQD